MMMFEWGEQANKILRLSRPCRQHIIMLFVGDFYRSEVTIFLVSVPYTLVVEEGGY